MLVAGVNGTGKTTTIGKLAQSASPPTAPRSCWRRATPSAPRRSSSSQIWGERTGAEVVARAAGADAAGLAYDALARARAKKADVLLIDTAGRLQNKAGLMAELEKIVRVIKKLDAERAARRAAGARCYDRSKRHCAGRSLQGRVPLTGLVMTKLDGTAKGGILVALAAKFGLPVHYIGVGEGEDDLQVFDAENFAKVLTGAS